MNSSYPGPDSIARIELSNGIVILVYENHSSPAVVIGGYLWAGSLGEPREQAGLSSFTAGMLMRGTETRTFSQINEALESVGARLSFHSGVHTVGFGGKALAEDLGLLLDMVADALQRPTFPSVETETLRGQILTDLQRRAHDTRRMAHLTFDALLYPEHPYGRSVQGYEDTIPELSRDDLTRYYKEHYSPRGMVITVVGAVTVEKVREGVEAVLGGWQAPAAKPDRSIPPGVQLTEPRRQAVPLPGKTQADIVLGWPGMTRKDPDYVKAGLTNTVLGVFGMMGRLGKNVRDAQGLAYYVYSRLTAGLGAGPWVAVAGVTPDNVEKAVGGILDEVQRLRDDAVPAGELEDSQLFLTGSMPLRLETNEGIAHALLDIERHELGLDYLERYAGLVDAVQVQDLQDMARKYLDPGIYALAVAGPEDE